MAENQEDRSKEDLTEEASPHRIEEFRRKGQVAQSREISGMLALLAAGAATYMFAPSMGLQLGEFMREIFRSDMSTRMDFGAPNVLGALMSKALSVGVVVGLPICLAGFIIGILGSFSQVGNIFSVEPLNPDLKKLDPIQGLKRLFSLKQFFEGIRLVFKMTVVVLVSVALVRSEIFRSFGYMSGEAVMVAFGFSKAAASVFPVLVGVLALFSGFDFALQRWDYSKKLRMTKQEAKQEHKEREGDPQIKARIRSVQREVARRRMMQAVKKADVVITNPTHIAVAIVYEKDKMAAPRVVAKGADFLAQKIKKIAAEAKVPMVENVPLARALYKSVKIGAFVPRALYQAVAEVLAYVYRLKGRGL